MQLIYTEGYKPQELTWCPEKANGQPLTTISLKKGEEEISFESQESDVFEFAIRMHVTVNKNGEQEFMNYRDLNRYWDDAGQLVDLDKSKMQMAFKKLHSDKVKFDEDPLELFRKFLEMDNKTSPKFLMLKEQYFEIFAYTTFLSSSLLKTQEGLVKDKPMSAHYGHLIDKIYAGGFRKNKDIFKNYLDYRGYVLVDIKSITAQTLAQKKHTNDLMAMLASRGKVDGDIAMPYMLDTYRRFSEIALKLMNPLRIAIELAEGVINPDAFKSSEENCAIIRNKNEYASLVKFLDPFVRHAESHISTEINKNENLVRFFDDRGGKKILKCQYSFHKIADMTNDVSLYLVPTLLLSMQLNEYAFALLVMSSYEYKVLLLGIGNKK